MSKNNPKIMVVEDENLLLQAIAKKLEVNKIETVSCLSGEQAIDYLKSIPEVPDAIWLDYHLKDMDGLAFLKMIKDNPKWKNIPVIVVSNSASPDKVQNMLALGADKYMLKAQYRLDKIIEETKKFIKKGV